MRALPCAMVAALAFAGCGGGDDDKGTAKPKGTSDPQAKAAAQAYLDAYSAKDPVAICKSLSAKIQKQLADNKGTCVKTVRFSLKGQKFPKLVVADALADGTTAVATITGAERQIRLQRESGWKVVDGGS
ncbi:MAG: hypothetical protein ACJ762_05340 [Solirubrobacteraceae bacterium]